MKNCCRSRFYPSRPWLKRCVALWVCAWGVCAVAQTAPTAAVPESPPAVANSPAAGTAANATTTAEGPGLLLRSWRSATDLQAWQGDGQWRLVLSPFSVHFRYSEEHRYVWAVGIERQRPDDWLAGFSFFRNSFGQPSAYAYVGKRFPQLFDQPQLFGQFSAGILYGYKGKYKTKVPLNVGGFAPGALLSLGWQFTPRFAVTAHTLGDAGAMLQLSYELK